MRQHRIRPHAIAPDLLTLLTRLLVGNMCVAPLTQAASSRERAIAAFARPANGGLIAGGAAAQAVRRDVIINLAARHRLPALYLDRAFVADGGLIAYGPDRVDQYRSAAGYVDRILNGEKPAELPVQAPTKYELVINLKAAKALGIEIPPMLLTLADKVIE